MALLKKNSALKKRMSFRSLLALSLVAYLPLQANPQNPTVVNGAVTISQPDPSTLLIQASDASIINWDSFSIAGTELTKFVQPSKSAAVLNRVTGTTGSQLHGRLDANGQVFLINPNGVLVGSGAVVNTMGFLAATLDVSDSDFIAGNDLLFSGSSLATVENQGKIDGWEGNVVLLGHGVHNKGIVNAPKGIGAFAAATAVVLSSTSDELITIITSANPGPGVDIGIQDAGSTKAGQIEMKADGNLFATAIKHSGVLDATGMADVKGRVLLISEGGAVEVSGRVEADGVDGVGGKVEILGSDVHLTSSAWVDASGDYGGGSIFIGGNVPGLAPSMYQATNTTVDASVRIDAQANGQGDGGSIQIWADGNTRFSGSARADAGVVGGNGGEINIAGTNNLLFAGTASTFSEYQEIGTLNLGSLKMSIGNVVTPVENNISPDVLAQLLQNNHVGVVAFAVASIPSTLTVNSPITWNAPTNLDLDANGNLFVNAGISYTGGDNRGNLFLTGGDIYIEALTNPVALAFPTSNIKIDGAIVNVLGGVADLASVSIEAQQTSFLSAGDIFLTGGSGNEATVSISGLSHCLFDANGQMQIDAGVGSGSDVLIQGSAQFFIHSPTS